MSISIETDFGQAEGYIINTEESPHLLTEYLKDHQIFDYEDVSREIASDYKTVAILHSMKIEKDYQGQGYGKQLLMSFISKASVDAVLLISDSKEPQRKGFKLQNFYMRNGFSLLEEASDGNLLIYIKS